jgi:hypothetical protein
MCDCDYCTALGIGYLSDPQSQIAFMSTAPLDYEKQGSEQSRLKLVFVRD